MLSVLPNIPVVIQPKFATTVQVPKALGAGRARSCDDSFELEKREDCNSDKIDPASNTERFCSSSTIDSNQFLRFICNAESQFVSPGTTALLVSGGLQRYLLSNQQRPDAAVPTPFMTSSTDMFGILNLPDSIQLHVFSFLDAKSLCAAAVVCRRWSSLSCDDLLWRRRLWLDVENWSSIGDSTNPESFLNDDVHMTPKEIYLRCSPDVAEWSRQNNFLLHRLSDIFRSFWPKKTPRVAMFGPGLESSTSFLVRKILEDKSGLFRTVAMFPGKFDGVGSGFTVKVNNLITLDLITIYNETKEVREHWSSAERLLKSRMLLQSNPSSGDVGQNAVQSEPTFELQHTIKDLCRTLDGFIFVVDATVPQDELVLGRPELFAMVNEQWTQSKAPVLILSCTPDTKLGHRISCKTVVEKLQLQKLNRPWQVRKCCVDTTEGIESAMHWLVETCQRQ